MKARFRCVPLAYTATLSFSGLTIRARASYGCHPRPLRLKSSKKTAAAAAAAQAAHEQDPFGPPLPPPPPALDYKLPTADFRSSRILPECVFSRARAPCSSGLF
jgi:hypothetical protein